MGDTEKLAGELAARLPAGSVLLLRGPLGAGKTTFVKYLARSLGFTGRVTSPTYTLMHVYPTERGDLVHADVYRLPNVDAIYDLGFEEAREASHLTVVEWGTPDHFPNALELVIEPQDETTRQVKLIAHHPTLQKLLAEISL